MSRITAFYGHGGGEQYPHFMDPLLVEQGWHAWVAARLTPEYQTFGLDATMMHLYGGCADWRAMAFDDPIAARDITALKRATDMEAMVGAFRTYHEVMRHPITFYLGDPQHSAKMVDAWDRGDLMDLHRITNNVLNPILTLKRRRVQVRVMIDVAGARLAGSLTQWTCALIAQLIGSCDVEPCAHKNGCQWSAQIPVTESLTIDDYWWRSNPSKFLDGQRVISHNLPLDRTGVLAIRRELGSMDTPPTLIERVAAYEMAESFGPSAESADATGTPTPLNVHYEMQPPANESIEQYRARCVEIVRNCNLYVQTWPGIWGPGVTAHDIKREALQK